MRKLSKPERWILLGIPVLFIIGSIMHFIYELTGELEVIGLFAPVNESLFEHLKLIFYPMILWWGVYFLINNKKYDINKERWFFACVISLVVSMFFVLAFFYTYTQAFGIESLIIDILIFLLSLLIGQLLGLHIYKKCKGISVYVSVIIIIFLAFIFALFTFSPPQIPLFKDSQTGIYGIK